MHSARRFAAPLAAVLVLGTGVSLAMTVPSAAATAPGSATAFSVHKVATARVGPYTGAGELRAPAADDVATERTAVANRSPKSRARKNRGTTPPSGVTPTQTLSVTGAASGFRALNHYEQRTADGGNQFSLVPPDQALCAGQGQLFEGVNNAYRVYSPSGAPLSDVVSANRFFWNDSEINRTTGVASPHQIGDPSCVYDAGSNRFFLTVYDLASDSAGNPTGPSFVDIAVSPVGTALGQWSIYQLDTSDDGRSGSPSHPNCPCFGDYPHLGTDANGLYITTNEFPTLVDGFNGAQVYAIDKAALAAGTATIPGAHFDTTRQNLYRGQYNDGFTLAPAQSADANYAPDTMYFLSSNAAFFDDGTSSQIVSWKIANTSALGTNPAGLRLTNTPIAVNRYVVPPLAEQKAGPTPLADCLNVTACAKTVTGKPNRYKEYEFSFDSGDTRMLQSAYANGKLWGALDTAVDVGGTTVAGVAYYAIDATTSALAKQGTLAVPGNHIVYPALGVTATGRAVMALTLTGLSYYPSAAYVRLDDRAGTPASAVRVVGAGAGPYDSFDGYRAFGYNRPRWGDYGAASVVGGQVYIASEYIAQSCSLAQYEAAPFGTCGNTRTSLTNWATHVAAVSP